MNKELSIFQRHLNVSILKTPPEFVEQKVNIDYVKVEYMKMIAYKEYRRRVKKVYGKYRSSS